jgi:hypothetical protein
VIATAAAILREVPITTGLPKSWGVYVNCVLTVS